MVHCYHPYHHEVDELMLSLLLLPLLSVSVQLLATGSEVGASC